MGKRKIPRLILDSEKKQIREKERGKEERKWEKKKEKKRKIARREVKQKTRLIFLNRIIEG